MNEVTTRRIEKISALHVEIGGYLKITLDKAIEIGGILAEMKAEAEHGEWSRIAAALPFDIRTAQRYIRAYTHRDQIKSDTVSSLTDAYRMIEKAAEQRRTPTDVPSRIQDIGTAIQHAEDEARRHAEKALRLQVERGRLANLFDQKEIVDAMCDTLTARTKMTLADGKDFMSDECQDLHHEWNVLFVQYAELGEISVELARMGVEFSHYETGDSVKESLRDLRAQLELPETESIMQWCDGDGYQLVADSINDERERTLLEVIGGFYE